MTRKSFFFVILLVLQLTHMPHPVGAQTTEGEPPAKKLHGKIESMDLEIDDTEEPAVFIKLNGHYNNGCVNKLSLEQAADMDSHVIYLKLYTEQREGVCSMALKPFSEEVDLDLSDLPPAQYIVNADGVLDSFEITDDGHIRKKEDAAEN